jgi:hypothetical protein
MTISLLQLTKYTDSDLYSARWLDDAYGINWEFNAVHQADGRPLARTEDCPAPVLTAEQLASAHPSRKQRPPSTRPMPWPPKARPCKPEWANRYTKAAQLVEAGQVRLTGPETAVVNSSQAHTVTGSGKDAKCSCKWGEFKSSEPCSHIMAMRMARALGQPIESPMAHGLKRTISVDDMWTSIYRQQNKARSRQRRTAVSLVGSGSAPGQEVTDVLHLAGHPIFRNRFTNLIQLEVTKKQ